MRFRLRSRLDALRVQSCLVSSVCFCSFSSSTPLFYSACTRRRPRPLTIVLVLVVLVVLLRHPLMTSYLATWIAAMQGPRCLQMHAAVRVCLVDIGLHGLGTPRKRRMEVCRAGIAQRDQLKHSCSKDPACLSLSEPVAIHSYGQYDFYYSGLNRGVRASA